MSENFEVFWQNIFPKFFLIKFVKFVKAFKDWQEQKSKLKWKYEFSKLQTIRKSVNSVEKGFGELEILAFDPLSC